MDYSSSMNAKLGLWFPFTWKKLARQLTDLHLRIAPLCVKITHSYLGTSEDPKKGNVVPVGMKKEKQKANMSKQIKSDPLSG
jgi:hypothetical protein